MRESDIKGVSCWERLRGPFDISRHSIYPIGTSCAIYNPKHLTWAPRADPGFYLGTNLLGFQSHRVLSLTTMAERDTVSLDWFPEQDSEPLHYEPIPSHLFKGDIIQEVAYDYFPATAEVHPPAMIPEGDPPVQLPAPSTPRKANSEGDPPAPFTPHGPLPEGGPPAGTNIFDTPAAHAPTANPPSHPDVPALTADFEPSINLERALYLSLYDNTTNGPNKAEWEASLNDEWDRQLHRQKTIQLHSTNGSWPKGSRVANVSLAARIKYDANNNISEYRTRVTWGIEQGNNHPDSASTTMTIPTLKTILHSTVSQPHKSLATIDIVDFYIQHDAEGPAAFLKTRNSKIPEATRIKLGTNNLAPTAIIVFKTLKVIYGQAEAGKISQRHLNGHLKKHGYVETSTSCLFKSTDPTNDIRIGGWSDDLIVQYDKRTTQLEDFAAMLKKRYPHRLHRITKETPTLQYLGYTITLERHPTNPSLDRIYASMPHYLPNFFKKIAFQPTAKPGSPAIYEATHTYSSKPQSPTEDNSPLGTDADKEYVQTVLGSLGFYGESVCPPIITPTNRIRAQQTAPTLNTMANLQRLLNWTYHNQHVHTLTFFPSNMQSIFHSDASYLNRLHSRSSAGGWHSYGTIDFTGPDDPHKVNAPIYIMSTTIKQVCSSVMEAETASMFLNAQASLLLRDAAENLGHQQGPTEIVYDNELSGKLVNDDIVKHKRSKVISMHYHWLKDRIADGQFKTTWKPGGHNLADFFTKIVPVHHFISMVPVFNAIRVRVPHSTAYHARLPAKRRVHFQAWSTTIISN